jgi:hypothetical protein
MPAFQDISGMRFGRLVAIERVENKYGRSQWRFRCDCGNETISSANNVKRGVTNGCGCLQREMTIAMNYKHGMNQRGKRSSEYGTWAAMVQRCTNRNDKHWKDYGGRGIEIYRPWRESFECFFQHIGERPSPQYSLDRKNNEYGYFPGNVRWATWSEQNLNKRQSELKIAA